LVTFAVCDLDFLKEERKRTKKKKGTGFMPFPLIKKCIRQTQEITRHETSKASGDTKSASNSTGFQRRDIPVMLMMMMIKNQR